MNNVVGSGVLHDFLDLVPLGVMFLEEGRVQWVNRCLADWLGARRDALVGLDLDTARPLGLAGLFGDDAELALFPHGRELRLGRCFAPMPDGREVQFFEDHRERVQLAQERDHYQELASILETKDPETGALNRQATLQALDSHLTRSRRYGNPVAVLRLSVQPLKGAVTPAALKHLVQELKAGLRWADQVGRLDELNFLAILPETRLADAEMLAVRLGRERAAWAAMEGCALEVVATAWMAGDDARKLLKRLMAEFPGR